MAIDKSQFVTPTQLAKMLGISRVAVHQKIKKGEIKAENVGDPAKPTYFIPKSSLSEELQARIASEQKKATESVIGKKNGHHDLGFEKELWAAADKLRGNIDVSEYKNIVLGLLFLKYISDAFEKRREVLAEMTRDPKNEDFYVSNEEARKQILETKDFYTAEGVFYVPEHSRWDYLRTKTMSSEIGKILDDAMTLIEKDNPAQLENVLPKVYTKTNLDYSVLGELVNIFSRITFDHDFDREKDILGRIYEYFLGQFASAEGKRGGEFFTPRSIVSLLVEILEPYENARVFDPACGSGGMFVSMGKYLREHGQDPSKLAISCQESNQTTMRLAKMNLAIRGLSGKIELGNSYYNDLFPHLQADFVIANPPFNAEWEPSKLSDNDPRITLGLPPAGNANFMWVQHFVHHLAPNGNAGFVMPNGALAVSGKESEMRKKLIEADLVDVIISCPSKLFYNVTLPVSLWFLSKNKSGDRFRNRKGETLLIDARNIFEQISKKQVVFNEKQINEIAGTIRAWRGEQNQETYTDVAGFCKAVKTQEIAANGYVLSPEKYVGSSVIAKKTSFADSANSIARFLSSLTEEEKKIDGQIIAVLAKYYPDQNWKNTSLHSSTILEKIAEGIFVDWFEARNIPSAVHGSQESLTSATNSWKYKNLDEVLDISIGRTPPRDQYEWFSKEGGDTKWISIKDLGLNGVYVTKTEERLTDAAIEKFSIPVIPENTVVVSFKLTIGRVGITFEKMLSNEAIAHLRIKKDLQIPTEYLYLFMKAFDYQSLASTSSIAKAVNSKTIKAIPLLLPDSVTLSAFTEIVAPIFSKIRNIETQKDRLLKMIRNESL